MPVFSFSRPRLASLAVALLLATACGREDRARDPFAADAGPHDNTDATPGIDSGPGGGDDAGPPPECTAPAVACGTDCADLATDSAHCGACDAACPAWTACAAPSCDAPPFVTEVATYSADWTQAIGVAPDGTVHVVYAYEESSGDKGIHIASRTGADWAHRTLRDDFPTRMGFSDIVSDADGTLHLCYFHSPDDTSARVAHLEITATGHREEVVFEAPAYDAPCTLARAPDGSLHAVVFVRDPSAGRSELFLASRTAAGAWERSTIATTTGDIVDADLVFSDDGVPHVTYVDTLGHLDLELRYAVRTGGTWSEEPIDRGMTIHDADVVIHRGAPLVAYIRDQGIEGSIATQINLAVRAPDGAWSLERITDERLGFTVALELDSRGVPHLAYAERSGGDSYRPVLAILRDAAIQRFPLEADFYMRSSDLRLAFAPGDIPHLSYFAYYPGEQVTVLTP